MSHPRIPVNTTPMGTHTHTHTQNIKQGNHGFGSMQPNHGSQMPMDPINLQD